MKPTSWHHIKGVFRTALEYDPEEREVFLQKACGDDLELQQEVLALLRAHDDSTDFLELPAAVALVREGADEDLCSTRIGHCVLESVLSSGALGAVYRATQEKPRRTVAVKVLREGLASTTALRRFEYESQILARLTHPNIAQVYEAGTHGADGGEGGGGLPYFVMEYVPEALPFTEYTGRRQLRIPERLRLFLQVCDAVHHGHQKGIIHRDLKPSNILVDSAGQVKVIDFGVARASDPQARLATAQTGVGQLIGTLQYMSPEQCRADPEALDIRSDVYALGVVLYELLCGRLPYEVERVPLIEATRVIQEVEPKRPSTLDRALRGDLQTILLAALEKDPAHRYQTVAALAADIRRWLDGDVVLARPSGPVTRTWKRIRRSPVLRTALGVSLLASAALIATILLVSYPQIRHERDLARAAELAALEARDTAESEAALNRAINDFVSEMLSAPNALRRGSEVKVAWVLDAAAARLGETFGDRPRVEGELRHTLASSYHSLGLYEQAAAQLEAVVEVRARSLGEEHPTTLRDRVHLGRSLIDLDRADEAESLLRPTAEIQERLLGPRHRDTLEARYYLASALDHLGEAQAAETAVREVLAVQGEVLGADHRDTLYSEHLLASVLLDQDRLEEAEEIARRIVDLSRAALGEEHPDTIDHTQLLAVVLQRMGRLAEAEPIYRRIIELQGRLGGEQHPESIDALSGLAVLLTKRGALAEAEPLSRKVVEVIRGIHGPEHPETLDSLNNLGALLARQGKLGEAREVFEEILELRRRIQGDEHSYTLGALTNLASVQASLGELAAAERSLREVLEVRQRIQGSEHAHTLQVRRSLAEVLIRRGELQEAQEIAREVLEISQRSQGGEHPDTLRGLHLLALSLHEAGHHEEAESLLGPAVQTALRCLSPANTLTANLLLLQGRVLEALCRHGEAAERLGEAYGQFAGSLGAGHPKTQALARTLVRLYEGTGDSERAAAWRDRLEHPD